MFELIEQNARLQHVNPRAETHGAEKVPACDLRIEAKMPNDFLSEFAPDLKAAIYRAPTAADEGGDLAATGGSDSLQKARFPDLGPLTWGHKYAGYMLTVHIGASGKSDIVIDGCEVNNIKFDCQDGGTVVCSMRIQANAEPASIGRLCGMIQQDIMVTLSPPEGA